MQRRLEGFVVGKQTVRQQRGWKIGRRTRRGKTNYFCPEAEVAEGFEIFAGADVTFSAETRDGRTYALNVQPKTATMEDSMRRRTFIIGGAVMAFVVLAVFVGYLSSAASFKKQVLDLRTELNVEHVVEYLGRATLPDLIPDSIVREAAKQGYAPAAVRHLVFQESVCKPILGAESLVAPEGRHSSCWWMLYAAYTAGDGKGEHVYDEDGYAAHYFNDTPLPYSTWQPVSSTRKLIMEKARDYFANPERLWAFYEAKRHIYLEEFTKLDGATQEQRVEALRDSLEWFKRFNDPLVREKWVAYVSAEATWEKATQEEREQDKPDSHSDPYWDTMEIARVQLVDAIGHGGFGTYHVLFAGRRFREGGQELVDTWVKIAEDALSRV